jgi:O-Antigen ligase
MNSTRLALPWYSAFVPSSGIGHLMTLSVLLVACVVVGFAFNPFLAAVPLAVVVVAAVVVLFVRYPRAWIYTTAVLNYFWIAQGKGEDEITLKEYLLVAYLFGGLAVWFVGMLLVKRRRIVRHTGDRLLLVALSLSAFNCVIAVLNDVPVLMWFREWLIFMMVLYYFPWREHLTERRHITTFLVVNAGVFVVIGAANVYQYVKAASNVLYAYQIWASRKTLNTTIFLSTTILSLLGAFYARARNVRLSMLLLAAFYAVIVVVSFSRGFWISTIVGVLVTLWLFDKRKVALFVLYGTVGLILFVGAVQIVFPDKATFVIKILQMRLGSSADGAKDVSLLARIYETRAVWEHLLQYPFGGVGLGTSFRIYDPMDEVQVTVKFIHNGYLFIWYKLGLPFFVLFYALWFYTMHRAYNVGSRSRVPLARILAMGTFGCFAAYLLLNITSSVPETRDGFYCLPMCLAFLAFAERLEELPAGDSSS